MRLPSETFWSYGCGVPALTTHLTVNWVGAAGQVCDEPLLYCLFKLNANPCLEQAPLTGAGGAPVATTLTTTPTGGIAGGTTNNQGIGGNGNNYNFGDNAVVNLNVGTVVSPRFFSLLGFWWFIW